jgi:thiol-disulfide isomerase/thioredoxin
MIGCDREAPAREEDPAAEAPRTDPARPVPEPEPEPETNAPSGLVELDAPSVGAMLRERPEPVLLVNVWSTWCEPCMEEFPGLVAVANEYRARGVGTIFVSMDARSQRDAANEFVERMNAPEPRYVRSGRDAEFIEALHPEWSGVLPATMLFDRERRVRYLFEEPVDRDQLSEPLESLLADGAEG